MRFRLLRLRFRRHLRSGQRQVEGLSTQAEKNIERHFFRRYARLIAVRRFVVSWLLLLLLLVGGLVAQNLALSNYFQSLKPAPGGVYREGILGTFTTANPLYATSDVDTSVSKLVFAGLLKHNQEGQLVGELAKSFAPDKIGETYTVKLKPGLKWHDGKPLTSADVVFTYQLLQNPDAQSPFQNSWRGISVTAPDAQTVVFKLTNPLAAFPHHLTNGIVPKHLLADIDPDQLRSADFNVTKPVGAGPFSWQALEVTGGDPKTAQEQIAFRPFANYARGKPQLAEFIIHAYADRQQLIDAFKKDQLSGVQGLDTIPEDLSNDNRVQVHNFLQRAASMVFFKTSEGILADRTVRTALVLGTNKDAIIKRLNYPTHAVRSALLSGQLGYDRALVQPTFNREKARQTLTKAGWKPGKDEVLVKGAQRLSFTLSAADTAEYRLVGKLLQSQWRKIGVDLRLQLQETNDFQPTLSFHNYDAVLYGIAIGVDPDVFVYWDSAQADIRSANRLNLSEYKSPISDAALEAGRTRLDPKLRTIKYRPFLQEWQKDNPAVGLYQPRLLYLTNVEVGGLDDRPITVTTDRFANIENWTLRQTRVTNP